MKRLALLLILASLLAAEAYYIFGPDDLESEIRAWLDSGRGRFEQWAAERDRHDRHGD